MKKYLALLLVLVMVLSLAACASKPAETTDEPEQTTTEPAPAEETKDEEPAPAEETKEEEPTEEPADNTEYAVAMITDYGDITDQSFNQTTYEACKAFCTENNIEFTYYKPAGDSTPDRIAMVEKAVDEGYNVIVMPGYAFAGTITGTQDKYPDVKFIALDVSEFDINSSFYKTDDKGNATEELLDANNKPHVASNVYSAVYQEELCGYMAGYAAVKLGYTELGFLGGMAVPAVQRYGYGFLQGADAAAAELKAKVNVKYAYGNQFNGDPDITAAMDTWYAGGTQVVFACGGSMFASVAAAAGAADGKVVGVDVDQSTESDTVITSAMKGLADSVQWALGKFYSNEFASIGGVGTSLGANENAVGLPTATWSLTKWTVDEYNTMLKDIVDGKITIDSDYNNLKTTDNVTLNII